ncbi:hypothetical protein MASR1M36_15080 [Candidatus Cloacimonadaceae bacterium]
MWIDHNSLDSEFETNFMGVVSKCLLLCQKIEKAYCALNGITAFMNDPTQIKHMDEIFIKYYKNKTLGNSIHAAMRNHEKSFIGIISNAYKDVPKFRNYIAHDVLAGIISIISEPRPIEIAAIDIIDKELKQIYKAIIPLIELDDLLNCLGWWINENEIPFTLPIHINYKKNMINWIFVGFDEKDYVSDET